MDKYSNKPLPMAPSIPLRSSSCKEPEKLSCEPGWPRRSTPLPRLPSTSEGLEILPATTYVPPRSPHRRLSDDPESLRLVEQRSVHLDLPPSAHRGVVFRSPTPSPPASPPLRHKNGRSNLNAITISDDSKRRECYILPQGQLEISFTPPSPVPSPRRLPMKRPHAARRTSRGNKRTRRTLVVLEIIEEERRLPKMAKKAKRNSLSLAYVRNMSKQSKRRSRVLQPKTRCPQIAEKEIDDTAEPSVTAVTATSDTCTPPSPDLPFTAVYRQILEERWAKYRLLDASKEEASKREVADFLAKTYPREPTPPLSQPVVVYPRRPDCDKPRADAPFPTFLDRKRSAERALALSAPRTSVADRRLSVSDPRLFPSPRELAEMEKQDNKTSGRKHFWSRATKKRDVATWKSKSARRD